MAFSGGGLFLRIKRRVFVIDLDDEGGMPSTRSDLEGKPGCLRNYGDSLAASDAAAADGLESYPDVTTVWGSEGLPRMSRARASVSSELQTDTSTAAQLRPHELARRRYNS